MVSVAEALEVVERLAREHGWDTPAGSVGQCARAAFLIHQAVPDVRPVRVWTDTAPDTGRRGTMVLQRGTVRRPVDLATTAEHNGVMIGGVILDPTSRQFGGLVTRVRWDDPDEWFRWAARQLRSRGPVTAEIWHARRPVMLRTFTVQT